MSQNSSIDNKTIKYEAASLNINKLCDLNLNNKVINIKKDYKL